MKMALSRPSEPFVRAQPTKSATFPLRCPSISINRSWYAQCSSWHGKTSSLMFSRAQALSAVSNVPADLASAALWHSREKCRQPHLTNPFDYLAIGYRCKPATDHWANLKLLTTRPPWSHGISRGDLMRSTPSLSLVQLVPQNPNSDMDWPSWPMDTLKHRARQKRSNKFKRSSPLWLWDFDGFCCSVFFGFFLNMQFWFWISDVWLLQINLHELQ